MADKNEIYENSKTKTKTFVGELKTLLDKHKVSCIGTFIVHECESANLISMVKTQKMEARRLAFMVENTLQTCEEVAGKINLEPPNKES